MISRTRTQYNDPVRRGIFERRRAHARAQWLRVVVPLLYIGGLVAAFVAGANVRP